MLGPTLTIARNTLVESIRQPIFFVVIFVSAVTQLLNTAISANSMGYRIKAAGEVKADDKLLLDVGLATVFVGGILLAAFVATAAVSREIENKTILTVISKPIGRPAVVLGKYLGTSAAVLIGAAVMLLHLLMAIDHGVMSTAADDVNWPIVFLGSAATLGALTIAGFGNFWYGWSFNQTFVLLALPLTLLAHLVSLPLDHDWTLQPANQVFRPQVLLASLGVGMALMVIAAIALAASTRLGQVMTIVVCGGVFVLGLLSNHFIGRAVYDNELAGRITEVDSPRLEDNPLDRPGETMSITLEVPSAIELKAGSSFYYGPNPNGMALITPPFPPTPQALDLTETVFPPGTPPALVVSSTDPVNERLFTVKAVGEFAPDLPRPPKPGDYVFTRPTKVNPFAMTLWALMPNFHHYWLVDAVTQASPIPPGHIALVFLYSIAQIGVCLSLAVLLFQGRDVG